MEVILRVTLYEYINNNDTTHSPRIAYSFDAAEFGAQGFLGAMKTSTNQESSLETLWAHVGNTEKTIRANVEYKNGKYSYQILTQTIQKKK